MGAIATIANRDLKSFFVSFKGSVTFCFLLLLMGMFFRSFTATFIDIQAQTLQMGGEAPKLSQLTTAIFQNLHFILLFIVPATTMSSFAEESKTQVDRLLQTAPVTTLQIVMGKFVASAGALGLVLIASAVYPFFLFKYGNPELGPIFTSYLGVFLLMCAQVAFGLWVSSMVNHQFLAYLFTSFGLFLLLILAWIAPNISGAGGAEEFVKYLAATPHLDNFFSGLITVADLGYFIAFIGLFLFFTNVAVDAKRWR
ncbi:MAG: ABC transporter permease [Chitinophagaceae bacterium]|nr:ABC transporter permease [Oligoflexus sp.]